MSVKSIHDARVGQAHTEVGQTEVSPFLALALAASFVVTIAVVPITQVMVNPHVLHVAPHITAPSAVHSDGMPTVPYVVARNQEALETIRRLTDRLDTDSILARHLRPAVQSFLTQYLKTGNEQVYTGRRSWLYYAIDVQHVVGRGFLDPAQLAQRTASGNSLSRAPLADPRPALLEFNETLARRGIALVIVPTPVKPSIRPIPLSARRPTTPVHNISFSRFVEEMRAAGVLVFDPAPLLTSLALDGDPVYLTRDTHWRPEAVVAVAEELSRFLERETLLPERERVAFAVSRTTVSNRGDTVGLLDLPAKSSLFPPETVEVRQILIPTGLPWRPDQTADILLLGDSFANIFSLEAMGWGSTAGLAEQLSFSLGRPVDRLVQNNNGAFATREALARELSNGHDRLAGKHVVVYQFSARELTHGDWRLIDTDAHRVLTEASSRILVPATGQELTVRGRIRQITTAPRPGTVPYRDHIIAVDLGEIDGGSSEALVYLTSMEDNVWTVAASLVVGQIITLTLRPWADVSPQLDGITRAELTEGTVAFAEPWWGDLTTLRLDAP